MQLDLFGGTQSLAACGQVPQALDVEAEMRRQEQILLTRQRLLRDAQLRLAAQRLWGFPNLVRNPDAAWASLRGKPFDLQVSLLCWPGYYLVRTGADGAQRIALRVRPGCDGNPAIPAAVQVLTSLAPVSLAPCPGPHPQYEAT